MTPTFNCPRGRPFLTGAATDEAGAGGATDKCGTGTPLGHRTDRERSRDTGDCTCDMWVRTEANEEAIAVESDIMGFTNGTSYNELRTDGYTSVSGSDTCDGATDTEAGARYGKGQADITVQADSSTGSDSRQPDEDKGTACDTSGIDTVDTYIADAI